MSEIAKRNILHNDAIALCPVSDFSIFTGFSCGDDDLNDYIQNDAKAHAEQLLAVTYALYLKHEGRIIPKPTAFACLLNDSLKVNKEVREETFPEEKRYSFYPALKIGRLGVYEEFRRMGLGSCLLDVVKELFLTDNRTGCRYITVDAYNKPATLAFYLKNEFEFLTDKDVNRNTRHMYFDLYRIRAGEGASSVDGDSKNA